MSKSKVSYLISDGLGPYFRRDIMKKIQVSNSPFSIQFDKTENAQDKEQCYVLVRFWNEQKREVRRMFLKSLMFVHANVEMVSNALIETLDEKEYKMPIEKEACSFGQ
ncbi:hypothetical protein DPMN_009259 [Dreissena polymorpha]|uniref:DUF4371 domain-containing protein n=1 Tax=Dreissena polymorpha TaxID=45954 RepID=A0A9D4N066_DREPO|nr:hypothetical protein DPMN_009259 [Dreissena polymorpha]